MWVTLVPATVVSPAFFAPLSQLSGLTPKAERLLPDLVFGLLRELLVDLGHQLLADLVRGAAQRDEQVVARGCRPKRQALAAAGDVRLEVELGQLARPAALVGAVQLHRDRALQLCNPAHADLDVD